jgi:hypothetical protein
VSRQHSIDSVPPEPASARIKVAPCPGCGGLPHGGATDEVRCLREALQSERAAHVATKRALTAAQAQVRELQWELRGEVAVTQPATVVVAPPESGLKPGDAIKIETTFERDPPRIKHKVKR